MLSLIAPLSFLVALLLLARLSARLGAQLNHRHKRYRWLYLSMLLIVGSVGIQVMTLIAPETVSADWATAQTGLLTVGLLLAILVLWTYWRWLLAERT